MQANRPLKPTTTYELPQPSIYRLVLKHPETPVDIKASLNKLGNILEKYFTWNDLVSEKIKEWAEGALKVDVVTKSAQDTERLMNKVEVEVTLLFNKVLISSMGHPLKTPILDELHTWDKDELIEYCNTYKFTFSPFNGFRLNVAAMKIHDFAMEMIMWASELPFEVELHPTQTTHSQQLIVIDPETGVPSQDESARKMNESLKLGAIAEQKLHDYSISRNMKNATAESKVFREKIEEYVQLEVERAARNAESKADVVREEIKISNEINDAKVKILNTDIEEQKKKIREAFEKLSAAEKENALNQARIKHLSDLYMQKQQEVEAMRRQQGGGGGLCNIF